MRSEGRSAPGRGCSPWGRARGGAEGRGAAARGEQRGAAPEGRALRYGAVLERRWESCRGKRAQDGFGKGGVPWGGDVWSRSRETEEERQMCAMG